MGNPYKSKDVLTFKRLNDIETVNFKVARMYINGVKTNYFVTTDGDIYSLKNGRVKKRKSSKDKKTGYQIIRLSVKNVQYTKLVHRLVALAFIPNPDNKPEVNHKDGNKKHNYWTNLEWVTEKENMNHAYKNGLHKIKYGKDKVQSKISEQDAKYICKLLEENTLTYKEIAQEVSCSKSIVKNIKMKKAWVNISKDFNIENYNVKESTCGNRRLTEDIVISICDDLCSGEYTMRDISSKYDIPYSKVNDIKQGKTWSCVSSKYNFENYNRK